MLLITSREVPSCGRLFALACGGDGTGPDAPGPAATIKSTSGANPTGTAGEPLAGPIVAQVRDAAGRGVPGVEVNFLVESGGGSLAAASVAPAAARSGAARVVVITDDNGDARASWTLGTVAGAQTASADLESASIGPIVFNATAVAGPVANTRVPGTFAGGVGAEIGGPLFVTFSDKHGNSVSGVDVSWSVAVGGGSIVSADASSNSSGVASATVRLGPAAGVNEFTVDGENLNPITISAIGLPLSTDPTGDDADPGSGLDRIDITRYGGLSINGSLVLHFEFTGDVASISANAPNSIAGFIEMDTDQNPSTGFTSIIDAAGGSSGLGVDHVLTLFADAQGLYVYGPLITPDTLLITGRLTPVFTGKTVTMSLALSSLGPDDGNVNLGALLGTQNEATDVAPNTGHLTVAPVPTTAPSLLSGVERGARIHLRRTQTGWTFPDLDR